MAEPVFKPGGELPGEIPNGYLEANARPGAFGSNIAEGFSRIGEGMGQASDNLQQIAQRRAQQTNMLALNSANNIHQAAVQKIMYGDPDDQENYPGFLNLKGQQAVSAYPQVQQQLDQAQKDAAGTLTNEAQSRQFTMDSTRYQQMINAQVLSHVGQQTDAWSDREAQAQADNGIQIAAGDYKNPSALSLGWGQAQRATVNRMVEQGFNPNDVATHTAVLAAHSKFVKTIAQAHLADNDAIGAQDFVNANRANMPQQDWAELTQGLQPHVWHQQGKMAYYAAMGQASGNVYAIPKGNSPDDTFSGMVHNESGGHQMGADGKPLTSSRGAVGMAQLMPDTARQVAQQSPLGWDENRFRNDPNYNRALGRFYFDQLCQKYGGNQTLACAAYNAGPGRVDQWVKDIGDPRTGAVSDADFVAAIPFDETRNYVSRTGAAQAEPGGPTSRIPPDWDKVAQGIAASPYDDEAKAYGYELMRQGKSIWATTASSHMADIKDRFAGANDAYLHGNDVPDAPTDQEIDQWFPPEQAQQMKDSLSASRQASVAYNGTRYASPAERVRTLRQVTDLTGADAQDYKQRQQVATRYTAMAQANEKSLHDDPVTYVANSPEVQAATQQAQQAQQSGDAAQIAQAQQNLFRASSTVQSRMGVAQPRILTNGQISTITDGLSRVPSGEDLRPRFAQLRQQYGNYYPQVMAEAVQHGKLDPVYGVMGDMTEPSQVQASADMHAAMGMKLEDMQKSAGMEGKKLQAGANADPIADRLNAYHLTTLNTAGGDQQYRATYQAVQRLATFYVMHGQTAHTAISNAVNGLIYNKYDTSGTIRFPKGQVSKSQVLTETRAALDNLKLGDLAPVPGNANLTTEDRQRYTLYGAKSLGQWVPDYATQNLYLQIPSRNGAIPYTVIRKDGKPVSVSMEGIRRGDYSSLNPYSDTALDRMEASRKGAK
ncbi:hypothetical protein JCM25156A_03820 [Komagataeibacter kakiaceti JCM 25156]